MSSAPSRENGGTHGTSSQGKGERNTMLLRSMLPNNRNNQLRRQPRQPAQFKSSGASPIGAMVSSLSTVSRMPVRRSLDANFLRLSAWWHLDRQMIEEAEHFIYIGMWLPSNSSPSLLIRLPENQFLYVWVISRRTRT